MIWLIPVGIGVGVIALILLGSKSAAASSSGNGTGVREAGDNPLANEDDAEGNDTRSPLTIGGDEASKGSAGGLSLLSVVSSTPTPGKYYRIQSGDIGTALCVAAYGGQTPYARWLHVAEHPNNKDRLGTNYGNWFLPRWDPSGSVNTGTYTGKYALVYMPTFAEVGP